MVGPSFMDSLAWHLKTKPPLALFLGATILCMGFIILSSMLAQQDLYFLNKIKFGFDYETFHKAAEILRDGGSPYTPPIPHPFTTPPLSAMAMIPLTYLPLGSASLVAALLTYVAVVASMFLVHRAFTPPPHMAASMTSPFCSSLLSFPCTATLSTFCLIGATWMASRFCC